MEQPRNHFLKVLGLAAILLASPADSLAKSRARNHKFAPVAAKKVTLRPYQVTNFSKDSTQVLLARMIFGEARGCAYEEQVAVAYTAVNRANDGVNWNGTTTREAILKERQYSCFNPKDSNRTKLMDPMKYDPKSFRQCLIVADRVLSGNEKDPTDGATHYYEPSITKPPWASKMREIGKIETREGPSAHIFYKEN